MELKFYQQGLHFDANTTLYSPIAALAMSLVGEHDLRHMFVESVLEADGLPKFLQSETPVASFSMAWQEHKLYLYNDGALWTWTNLNEGLGVRGFYPSLESAAKMQKRVKEETPRRENKVETIDVNFWHWSQQNGAMQRVNRLTCPKWDEITGNYTLRVRHALDHLTALKSDSNGLNAGRILLWCGAPGTGKTWAIRMLARAWRWAKVHYIIDPDEFFSRADYMIQALGTMQSVEQKWSFVNEDAPALISVDKTWNLLVLEDAGELVSADAKVRTGQGLSKLLNLTDGLVGQGTNLMVLITTNEEFGSLHPAISRYGRCLSNIPFKGLTETETQDWLKAHKFEGDIPRGGRTLSELYGLLAGVESNDKAVGFKA